MRKTIILSLFTVACLLFSSQATAQSYLVEIANAEGLAQLAQQVNNGTDYSGRTVTLKNDIDLSGYDAWTPIGIVAHDYHFKGTFDGNNHRITGLKVNAQDIETGFVAGLFGVIGINGTVKNLTVVTEEVRINKETIKDGVSVIDYPDTECHIGGIAGQNLGTIVGCANRGVSVYGNWGGARVGGIAGLNSGSIQNCYNLGEVYTSSTSNNVLGGIAGQNGGTIKNCFVRAIVDEVGGANHGPISGNNSGTMTGCFYMNGQSTDPNTDLVLNDNAANNLGSVAGQTKNVLLDGRTIYSDGAWNTICLPFNIGTGASGYSPIAGASVKELDATSSGFDASTGVLTLNFTDATSIVAGRPYIVKWDEAIAYDLSNPVFLGVTVNSADAAIVSATNVDFIGSYSPIDLTGEDKSLLYLGSGNTLYYPSAAMQIGSCRAYFQLAEGITAGEPVGTEGSGQDVRAFVLNFGDDEPTSVTTPLALGRGAGGEAWHTLDGRKLNGKPSRAGVYINKGKKVAIK